ncbi:MAG TPA: 30S ribosomal protein S12 methylthiotransferase RimO [Candidatus Eisenbacteria bacterium]|nr:30S ribosomal protein S12 methylthiotransferase RimO [Candidatus Eisenbacteria bacterium]
MKVGLVSLGCARTLVDSEVALGALKKSGYEIVSDIRKADVAVVNTCGFIEEAKVESIEAILRLCEMKKKGKLAAVVVLGCLAQRHGEELRKEIGDEVDAIIGTDSFEALPKLLDPLKNREKVYLVKEKPRYLLNEDSPRFRLTPEHFAYVKISEGCINACSYCVIPRMKGAHRSRTIDSILAEIERQSAERRLSEVNLIGQDTAAFGWDADRTFQLPKLLRAIQAQGRVPWVRLLYAHPGHVTEELIDAMAESPSICKYVDFPIEHSHDDMLKRMNRGVTREKMVWGLETMRRRMPSVSVRTTVIVGFPGETEDEFRDLMAFLREARFERLGAFQYSDEEGARSAGMGDKIAPELKKERFDAVMAQQRDISLELNEALVGRRIEVLIDEADAREKGVYYGRSHADAPEVDCQVTVRSAKPLSPGDFVTAEVTDALEYDLLAKASP